MFVWSIDCAVLDILKGNADQLVQLKQAVVAEKQVSVVCCHHRRTWWSPPAVESHKQKGNRLEWPHGVHIFSNTPCCNPVSTQRVQAAKENSKKMMLWMTGGADPPGGSSNNNNNNSSSAALAGQLSVSDAVKQRGFRPLQLPGSSLAAMQQQAASSSNPAWPALKFWQIGTHNSRQSAASGGRGAGQDTPAFADQQPHNNKSLSSMLFGNKSKRHSGGGGGGSGEGAAAASRRASIDPAASWRSSIDGSFNGRHASNRSSDGGAAMMAAAAAGGSGGGAAPAAGSSAERGAVMTSLAAGEGPLSKSHSMLATKPGTQQEQILGKSLEIVAEDEREGRGERAGSEGRVKREAPAAAHGSPQRPPQLNWQPCIARDSVFVCHLCCCSCRADS